MKVVYPFLLALLVGTIILVMMAGCSGARPMVANPSQEDIAYVQQLRQRGEKPFGMCHVLSWRDAWNEFSDATLRKKLQLAKDIGVQWSRGGNEASWHDLATESGLKQQDRVLSLLKEYGMESVMIYSPMPPKKLWVPKMYDDYKKVEAGQMNWGTFMVHAWLDYQTPAWWDEWRAFNQKMALHFRGKVRFYEFYNEPNQKASGDCPPGLYARLLMNAAKSIREVDPQAKIVLGGLGETNYAKWLGDFYSIPDMHKYFDILSLHPYNKGHKFIQDCLRIVPDKDVWITEDGYAGNAFPLTQMMQANALRGSYLVYLKRYPRVKKVFWYCFCDYHLAQYCVLQWRYQDKQPVFTPMQTYHAYGDLERRTRP